MKKKLLSNMAAELINWLYVEHNTNELKHDQPIGHDGVVPIYKVPSASSFNDMRHNWPNSYFENTKFNNTYWIDPSSSSSDHTNPNLVGDISKNEDTKPTHNTGSLACIQTSMPVAVQSVAHIEHTDKSLHPKRQSWYNHLVNFLFEHSKVKNVYILTGFGVNVAVGMYCAYLIQNDRFQIQTIAQQILTTCEECASTSSGVNFHEYIGLKTRIRMFFTHLHK